MLQQVHKVAWNNMGNYHSRPALSAWPRTSQTFFPDTAAREREDAAFYEAFYESMRFMPQEGTDDSDDEQSDETTATSPETKRAMWNSLY